MLRVLHNEEQQNIKYFIHIVYIYFILINAIISVEGEWLVP